MKVRLLPIVSLLTLLLAAGCTTQRPSGTSQFSQTPAVSLASPDRCAFIGIKDFDQFKISDATNEDVWVLTSPEIPALINWDELILSWNAPPGVYLKAEARAIFPDHTTKYYTLDMWSDDPAQHPRQSVRGQRDADGTVKIDTLVLNRHGGKVQIRLTLGSMIPKQRPAIKFLGISFCDSATQPSPREPNRAAWGKVVDVPERRQAEYEGGGGWCSPTSLSMVMAYWSDVLHRPELNHTVPETAAAINDDVLDGTGNWPFNTAFAGEFPGMRAYVTRFDDISELEDWIVAGVAPIISVSSYLTNNRTTGPDNGHLIVCCGFTENGDMIANDPGVSVKRAVRARRVYPRERVINAWKKSKNAVYLVYPENLKPPQTRPEHWDH